MDVTPRGGDNKHPAVPTCLNQGLIALPIWEEAARQRLVATNPLAAIEQVASTIGRGLQIASDDALVERAQDGIIPHAHKPRLIGFPAIDVQRLQSSADLAGDDRQAIRRPVKPLTNLPRRCAALLIDFPSLQSRAFASIGPNRKHIDTRLIATQGSLIEF